MVRWSMWKRHGAGLTFVPITVPNHEGGTGDVLTLTLPLTLTLTLTLTPNPHPNPHLFQVVHPMSQNDGAGTGGASTEH